MVYPIISLWRSVRNGRLMGAWRLCPERNRSSSVLWATPPFSCLHCRSNLAVARSITFSSSSYAGQTSWEGSEMSSSPSLAHSCPGVSRAIPAGSEDVSDNTSSSSSLSSSAADERKKLFPLSISSASSICDPHDQQRLDPSRGGQMIYKIILRKGTNKSGAFPKWKAHNERTLFPREQSVCALRPNT